MGVDTPADKARRARSSQGVLTELARLTVRNPNNRRAELRLQAKLLMMEKGIYDDRFGTTFEEDTK